MNRSLHYCILMIASLCTCAVFAQSTAPVAQAIDPLQQAQTAISKRDWSAAETLLHPLTISQPRNPFVFYEMAQVYENTGRIDAARQIYRGLITIPDANQRQYAMIVRSRGSSYMTSLASLSQAKLNMLNVNYPASAATLATGHGQNVQITAASHATLIQPKAAISLGVTSNSIPNAELALNQTLQTWAKAWANKDIPAYVSHYVPGFKGDLRLSSAWQQQRERNIRNKKLIELDISDIQIKVQNSLRAQIRFQQSYRADGVHSMGFKTLSMLKQGQIWLIERETTQ